MLYRKISKCCIVQDDKGCWSVLCNCDYHCVFPLVDLFVEIDVDVVVVVASTIVPVTGRGVIRKNTYIQSLQ